MSAPYLPEERIVREEGTCIKKTTRQDGVKTEVCLTEERNKREEEQWVEVWEEDIKREEKAREFQVTTDRE